MKHKLSIFSLACCASLLSAQTTIIDFETFTLSPSSAYSPTTSTPFQSSNVLFQYEWDNQWSFWSGGFSYTNIHDSITPGFLNEYGVRAYKGFNNSSTFIVGLDESKITLTSPQSTVNGFYVTNTTYAYKSMASGDMFARKFGDTTGTGSGTTIAQGSYPDYFKLVVKGYKNGQVKNDSVTVFLANFTFTNNAQDFILDSWQYVNTSILGAVDSIQFFMRSSDVGEYGINTPMYFAIDNFETASPNTVGVNTFELESNLRIFPNPCQSSLIIQSEAKQMLLLLRDMSGKALYSSVLNEGNTVIEMANFEAGIYFVEVFDGNQKTIKKVIKN